MKKIFLIIICNLILFSVANAESLPNPISSNKSFLSPDQLVVRLIKVALGLTGTISLIVFIWGGLLWTSSAGKKEQIEKGRNTMIWAVVGLVVTFASYAIIKTTLELITF